MEKEEIIHLLERISDGTASESDIYQYNKWCGEFQKDDVSKVDFDKIKASMLAEIENKIHPQPQTVRAIVWPRIAVAASIICVLLLGGYLFNHHSKNQIVFTKKSEVVPGGNKAVLTLDNGHTILLNDAKSGFLANQGNVKIIKTAAGIIVYAADNKYNAGSATLSYNTISTPRGGQFQLELPDGTKVWLNAASSLRYPVRFGPGDRRVVLSGEAYFEVAKDATRPFKVSIGAHTEVKVLGTHFDVMAYPDEAVSRTTLLEGSVQISVSNFTKVIVPGEQATVGSAITVKKVNVKAMIGWKDGMFNFTHEKLPEVMRKIARWYDIDLVYEGKHTNLSFVGTLPRSQNINEILDYLELTGLVHFKINGRRIIIMP